MSNWNWKVVRQFLKQSFDLGLSRSSCLNYLHRLGFVLKRPKKRLLKAKDEARESLRPPVQPNPRGGPREWGQNLLRRRSPLSGRCRSEGEMGAQGRAGAGGLYQSSVGREGLLLLESLLGGWGGGSHEIAGNSNAETSTAFLRQLREKHPGPLVVIWDNGPAHRGAAIRSYLTTPDLQLRLVALPAYSPDFNADEAVWDWAREEVTANECLGTKAQVQEKMNAFFGGLAHRKDEVKHRCRTLLQARADALIFTPSLPLPSLQNVVPTLALV